MTQALTSDNLKELLSFPFRDPNWQNKFLIGSLVVLVGFFIPIVPFMALYGYIMPIMRRIIAEGGQPFMPEWDDWSTLLTDGAKLFGVVFIYILPIMVLLFAGYAFLSVMIGFSALIAEVNENEALLAMAPLIGGLVMVLIYGLVIVLALALGAVLPAIMGHVVATNEFNAAFRWREWWAIFRANLSGFILAYLILIALSVALSSIYMVLYLTIILCCLAPIVVGPVTMYTMLIYAALFGQAYREGVQRLKNYAQ